MCSGSRVRPLGSRQGLGGREGMRAPGVGVTAVCAGHMILLSGGEVGRICSCALWDVACKMPDVGDVFGCRCLDAPVPRWTGMGLVCPRRVGLFSCSMPELQRQSGPPRADPGPSPPPGPSQRRASHPWYGGGPVSDWVTCRATADGPGSSRSSLFWTAGRVNGAPGVSIKGRVLNAHLSVSYLYASSTISPQLAGLAPTPHHLPPLGPTRTHARKEEQSPPYNSAVREGTTKRKQ